MRRARRTAARYCRVSLLVPLLAACLASALGAQTLELRFLDVGQGDAALIITPDKKAVLIDAGPDRRAVAVRVAEILRAKEIPNLTLAIASHAHADHIGGMAEVLTTIPVSNYMDNGQPHTTATYRRTMEALEAREEIVYLRAEPRTLNMGSVSLRILPMPELKKGDPQNNRSVGVLVTYGKFTALFTGDAEAAERTFWRKSDSLPRVTVLKVAHHGSRNGTDAAWLRALRPQLAIVSVGAKNDYGHPHASALSVMAKAHVPVLRTDSAGDVTITARENGSYAVQTSKPVRKRSAPVVHSRTPGGCVSSRECGQSEHPPADRMESYVIDRLEGKRVVLVRDEDAASVGLSVGEFGRRAGRRLREGLVLRVPVSKSGEPHWDRAVIDLEETERRIADARARLDRLRRRDPGGDLEL